MSFSERRAWIVAYDITCPKRLVRVHHYLRGHALTLQYSVFGGVFSARTLQVILNGLRLRIDADEDDVRVYPVPAYCEVVGLGARLLPQGVILPDERLLEFLHQGCPE